MNSRTLSAPEAAVVAAIDVPRLLETLGELIAIPSHSGHERACQEVMATYLADAGMHLDVWELDLPALRRHPAYAEELDRIDGLGVVGSKGRGQGPVLILNGHCDVVPAGDLANWRHLPWQSTISEGRVYGRGALDMKGGLCCALAAVQAIQAAGIELAGQVQIHSVIGEEDGGVGTLAAIQRGYRADGAIVLEPTNLAIAPSQAGALNFRLTVPGRAAHGSFRAEGVNPLDHFIPLYAAIMALERRRNAAVNDPLFADYELPFAICIGTIEAGNWASTVAESLTCAGRFGVRCDETPEAARRQLEAAVAEAAAADPWLREHPPRLEWWGGQFAPASIPADHPLVRTTAAALTAATGRPARIQGMPYGADMRLLVNQGGIPTVLFGPGDVRLAHRPDEYVPVADLVAVSQALVVTILRFCGVAS